MKLRNKKTGEIIEVESLDVDTPTEGIVGIPSFDRKGSYNSLAELNEEWEDYEEPKAKEYWFINDIGDVEVIEEDGSEETEDAKQIGNYFETKEEAEKAVEKLKAVKRLKDKGFRFIGKTYETDKRFGSIFYKVDEDTYSEDIIKDLDLLFGGEE